MALRLSKPASGIIKDKPSKQLCVSADIRIPAPSDQVSNYKRQDLVELEGARVVTVKWTLWELHGLINKPLWLCALVCLFFSELKSTSLLPSISQPQMVRCHVPDEKNRKI